MDAVENRLFVGTIDDAENTMRLRDRSVDAVVSLTHDLPCISEVSVTRIPMVDGPQNDAQTFERAVIEMLERLEEGDRVLVHCSAGASRSPAVAAMAFALHTQIGLEAAFEEVVNRRDAVDPHEAVVRQAARVYIRYSDS
jgi:protein-tyrosine phosphatase